MVKAIVAALVVGALGFAQAEEASPAAEGRAARQFVIFFDHGGPWIPESAQSLLPQVAEIFGRAGYAAIAIDCYSDNVGTQELNLALTQDRADRIKTDLVRYKVPEGAVTATGHGFADPLVEGMQPDTAISNRRCEIKLS
jgi:OOP family OmpA-OmpF porin